MNEWKAVADWPKDPDEPRRWYVMRYASSAKIGRYQQIAWTGRGWAFFGTLRGARRCAHKLNAKANKAEGRGE